MNARRVHELFAKNRLAIDFADCYWTHLLPGGVLDETILKEMISIFAGAPLIIHVQRKIGGVMPVEEGLAFIREHLGKGNIHVFDARFENWLVIAQNGVGTTWSRVDDPS